MDGSWTVRVLKRGGRSEPFESAKLAAAMWRAMAAGRGRYRDARDLAEAIDIYLKRTDVKCISSAALFEMSLKVLRRVRLDEAAEAMESYRALRNIRRRGVRIRHDCGRETLWDKGWLCEMARASWHVSPSTARIVAGQLEQELLQHHPATVPRQAVVERLNRRMVELGLADAVPVPQ